MAVINPNSLARVLVTLILSSLASAQSKQYSLVKDYSGQNFLSGFSFLDNATDVNGGNLHWVPQATATSLNMTFVDPNTNHVIIKVDDTTVGNPADGTFGRNSIYLMSNDQINVGTLLLFDVNQIPYGCSVWPSLFTKSLKDWPAGGEIDIIENINLATNNQYALHTAINCNQPQGVKQTGNPTSTNCTVVITSTAEENSEGCVVAETQPNSFGAGFASNGGGVFAMQWESDGISLWFFPRSGHIPGDISATSNNPDPSTWSTPSAFYPSSGCDFATAFEPQTIVLDIDICGTFAGFNNDLFHATCPNVGQCTDLVRDPANYVNASWNINYLRVFSSAANGSSGGGNGTGTSPGPASRLLPSVVTASLAVVIAFVLRHMF